MSQLHTGKWIAHEKSHQPGAKRAVGFEFSVIREDFQHGQQSYGWFGQSKILVAEGHCDARIWPDLQAMMLKHAATTAEKFNTEATRK